MPRGQPVHLTIDGRTRTLSEWAKITGVSYYTIKARYKLGWLPDAIIDPENHRGQDIKIRIHNRLWTLTQLAQMTGLKRTRLYSRYCRGQTGSMIIRGGEKNFIENLKNMEQNQPETEKTTHDENGPVTEDKTSLHAQRLSIDVYEDENSNFSVRVSTNVELNQRAQQIIKELSGQIAISTAVKYVSYNPEISASCNRRLNIASKISRKVG